MQQVQEKVACTLHVLLDDPGRTHTLEGLAHIVQTEYDDEFKPWFAVIDCDLRPRDMTALTYKLAQIQLEDGRVGKGLVSQSRGSWGEEDGIPQREGILYVCGLDRLCTPEPAPQWEF